MKILIVGSGGREHALAWKISQSSKVRKIYCAPGNAGISQCAECIPIPADDLEGLLGFVLRETVDLTVVGPEAPLSLGIVDRFEAEGLRIFGPTQKAAEIESSKGFAKSLMKKYGIPTASGETFSDLKTAERYLRNAPYPLVVKADGLAAGKGVLVCENFDEAAGALRKIMLERAFGEAGDRVVVEEFLTGEEVSFLAFTDGKTVLPLPTSQDHKAIFDQDKGPNTGGMGAYSPAPLVDGVLYRKILKEVMNPVVQAMAEEGRPYKGVLYAGLMVNRDRIRVLEFNARFGDPEAQPLLMRLQSDIVPVLEAVVDGRLSTCRMDIDDRPAVCVVMASGGYPGSYRKGDVISGLKSVARMRDVMVFHAGTAMKDSDFSTAGGRVLGVTAMGNTIEKAIGKAYQAAGKITWKDAYFRKDIGQKALRRLRTAPRVGVIMGSDSDLPVMEETAAVLRKFAIPYEMTVGSAHRTPERSAEFAASARKRGIQVIIAGAGHAAHLAGVLAAHTSLPVIGVPIDSSCLKGWDSLLSTVQMPPGVPVATVSIGKSGARNAGILAVQILAVADDGLAAELDAFKADMAAQVEAKARRLEKIN